jgi:hypothetical protein
MTCTMSIGAPQCRQTKVGGGEAEVVVAGSTARVS